MRNFESAEEYLVKAEKTMNELKAYAPEKFNIAEYWWILLIIPAGLGIGGIFWYMRRGAVKVPKYIPEPAVPKLPTAKVKIPILEGQSRASFLAEIEALKDKISAITEAPLGKTERYYYEKVKKAIDSVTRYVQAGDMESARKAMEEVESHLKMLEYRLLTLNLVRKDGKTEFR